MKEIGVAKLGLSKPSERTGQTETGPDRTEPTTFGPVLGLDFWANSVSVLVGPVLTDHKPTILPYWTRLTDRPTETG